MNISQKVIWGLLASALLIPGQAVPIELGLSSGGAASTPVGEPKPSVPLETGDPVRTLRPVWTAAVDFDAEDPESSFGAQTSEGLIYSVSQGRIRAVEASNGRLRWTSAHKTICNPAIGSGTVSYMDEAGRILRLEASTGKTLHIIKADGRPPAGRVRLSIAAGRIYAADTERLRVYAGRIGQLIWKIPARPDTSYPKLQGVHNGVAIVSVETSGSILATRYEGYDVASGRRVWELIGSHGDLLAVRKGHFYARSLLPGAERYDGSAVIDQVDIRSGKLLSSLEYRSAAISTPAIAGQVLIENDRLYSIVSGLSGPGQPTGQGVIGRFELDQPETPVPLLEYGKGRPPVRLDLIGSQAYAAQANGNVYLIDLRSSRTLGVVETSSSTFGPVLSAGGMTLIQAEGKLIAVERPEMNGYVSQN